MGSIANPIIMSFSPDSGIIGDGITDADLLTLSGTAVAGSTVSIFDGTTLLGTATANTNGAWSFLTNTLLNGTHTFTATDTYAGNTSQASSPLSVTVDTTPPVAPAIASLSGYGAITNGGMTSDDVLTLGGTAEPNSTVTVLDGTKSLGTAAVNGSGAWVFTTGQVGEGSHSFTAIDTDAAGNVSPVSSSFNATVETLSGGAPGSIGVNMNGAEYSWGSFPSLTDLEYVKSEDVNLVRLPIGWEMMQSTLDGPLNSTYLAGLKSFLSNAASLGIQVIVDLHNSGTYNLHWASDLVKNYGQIAPDMPDASVLGSAAVPISAFANFWQQLATALNGNPAVAGYDIMNEPKNMPSPSTWPAAAQAAVNAIRAVDMNTPITVEGDNYAMAAYWQQNNANLHIIDPANHLIYSAHAYFDNGSGQPYAQQGVTANTGVQDLQPYLQWLQENNYQGYVGETGVPNVTNDPQWVPLLNNVLNTLQADGVSATAWNFEAPHATDPSWWVSSIESSSSSNFNIAPINGQINPVMALIFEHSAPVITSFSPNSGTVSNAITNARVLVLTGIGAGNATVNIYDGATLLGTTTASINGAWSFTTGTLANGAHSFTATDMDSSGDISETSAALAVTVNKVAPSTPAVTAFSPDSGVVGDGITNATTLTLTGTAAANSTVTVFDGTTQLGTAAVNGSGAWSFTTGTLSNATHSFTATDTDAAGNTSVASSALAVTVDTVTPSAPVIASDAIVNTNEVMLTGTAEANSIVTVYDGATLLGAATANASGAWSYTTGQLSNGPHAFTATATDAAGNTSVASQALDPTIGTGAPPAIASFSPDSGTVGDGITNATTLTLTGTAAANSTVKVYDGATLLGSATANGSGAWNYTTAALSDGAHSLTAAASDAAGNTGVASAALVVTVDTVAPNAPVIVSDTTINTNEVALSGTAEANSTVNVFEGTTQLGTATVDASGAWSFTTGPLSSGTHTFTATATDGAGNTSATSQPIDPAIDPAAPPSIVAFSPDSGTVGDGITNANTLTLTGAAVASSTVNIYDGTTLLGTAASNGSGAWSFTTATLVNGSHSFTATDTVSGATSAASAALAVTVDTVAPAVTDHLASDTGSSSTDMITSNDMLTGSGDPNAVLHFTVDGTPIVGTATANSSGVWTFAPTGLADGHHTIVASETDAAGNTGTASLTFTLDTKAPVVTESLAKDTGSSSTDKITSIDTLTGSGDPNAVVHFTVDGNLIAGTATANSSSVWTFTPTGLANGTHTIVASETDAAGNTGNASLTFTFDTTAPTTTIADIVQKTANNISTTTISGTSEAGSLVTLYEGNHVLGTATVANTDQWSISLNSLSNTVHNFAAAATDLAGNKGTLSQVAIFGSTGSDNIVGVAAGDIIVSSGGADKLTAGSGNDTFIFNPGFGKDTVSKFDLNHDVLAFDHTLFASVANVLSHAHNIHGNAVITFDSGDTVTLVGIKTAQLLAHQNDIHII